MDHLSELRIVDSDGQESLLTERGRPRASEVSDHLPVLVRLEL
jgi:endonuclease/exonuclease/phosphatase family metal-dependent hydrolase